MPARRVLALTFTNKAARELRERITRLIGPDEADGLLVWFDVGFRGSAQAPTERRSDDLDLSFDHEAVTEACSSRLMSPIL